MAFTISASTGVVAMTALVLLPGSMQAPQPSRAWQADFNVDKASLMPTGRNRFFVLEPGQQSVFSANGEQLTITVLGTTARVDGVTTAVVEERETKNGVL